MDNHAQPSRDSRPTDTIISRPFFISTGQLEKDVFNAQGEHLGQLEDIILDLKHQRIAFGILSFSGIFGLREKHFAIPWDMLNFDQDENLFTLDINPEQLTQAESFEPGDYPHAPNTPWADNIYQFWGFPFYW